MARPFSTVSGVLVRSCEPSLGAIFCRTSLKYYLEDFGDENVMNRILVDDFVNWWNVFACAPERGGVKSLGVLGWSLWALAPSPLIHFEQLWIL